MTSDVKIYIAKGQSMNPLILDGDLLLVSKKKNYGKGDIVVFLHEDHVISHRIIYCQDQYVTKGDNSLSVDTPIKENLILGKVDRLMRVYDNSIIKTYSLNRSLTTLHFIAMVQIYSRKALLFSRQKRMLEPAMKRLSRYIFQRWEHEEEPMLAAPANTD